MTKFPLLPLTLPPPSPVTPLHGREDHTTPAASSAHAGPSADMPRPPPRRPALMPYPPQCVAITAPAPRSFSPRRLPATTAPRLGGTRPGRRRATTWVAMASGCTGVGAMNWGARDLGGPASGVAKGEEELP